MIFYCPYAYGLRTVPPGDSKIPPQKKKYLEYIRAQWKYCCPPQIFTNCSTHLNMRENSYRELAYITWTIVAPPPLNFNNHYIRKLFWSKYIQPIWHHKLNITVTNFYVIIMFYVQNIHYYSRYTKSAVACGSLSLQRYQWISWARQSGRPGQSQVRLSTRKLFWLRLQLMVRLQHCPPPPPTW